MAGELNDEEKAEALQGVGRIATAGAEPNLDDKTKGIVKRATATLKGLTEALTDTSKLVAACKAAYRYESVCPALPVPPANP